MKSRVAVLVVVGTIPVAASADAGDPPIEEGRHFMIDPVADIVLTAAGAGAAGITEMILSTGEIVPQSPPTTGSPPQPDTSKLLSFDRIAVTQTVDPNASTFSDIGLGVAIGFAAIDPVLSGLRDGWDAALVDAVMYAESASITLFVTDVTKIAVRRPRPLDYSHPGPDTNNVLSFFSGHASLTGAIAGTASYLAFARSPPGSPRPWITLGASALLTGFVSYERVRSGAHFPTDVIAGSMAGAAIGVLIPHFHYHGADKTTFWIGAAPMADGGSLAVNGVF